MAIPFTASMAFDSVFVQRSTPTDSLDFEYSGDRTKKKREGVEEKNEERR